MELATCCFCGESMPVEDALDAGWIPDFFMPDGSEVYKPACLKCQNRHIDLKDNLDVVCPGSVHLVDRPIRPPATPTEQSR